MEKFKQNMRTQVALSLQLVFLGGHHQQSVQ